MDADWVARVGWRGPVGLGMEGDGVGQEFPVRCAGSGASGCQGDMQELESRCSQELEGVRVASCRISVQGCRGSLKSRRGWNALVLARSRVVPRRSSAHLHSGSNGTQYKGAGRYNVPGTKTWEA